MLPGYDRVGGIDYTRLFSLRTWDIALTNLAMLGILYIAICSLPGLTLAILFDRRIRTKAAIRTIYLYPMALSFIVIGVAWKWDPGIGIEAVVRGWGWEGFAFDWIKDRDMAIHTIAGAAVWQTSGFAMAMFLAGLRGIDDAASAVIMLTTVAAIATFPGALMAALPTLPVYIVAGRLFVRGGRCQAPSKDDHNGFSRYRPRDQVLRRGGDLNETDIPVEKGAFLVLVGPTGGGRSTLPNMIAGLETVTREIPVDGLRMNEMRPAKRNIAMVFQSYALYPGMTARGNISFAMEMHKIPGPERGGKTAKVAEVLQITDLPDRKPGQLSGGQRQRGPVGRALTLSTRIAVMFAGDVQQIGTPHQACDDPADMFVAGFMGSPAMTLLPATATRGARAPCVFDIGKALAFDARTEARIA